MDESPKLLRFVIAGQPKREFIITQHGKAFLDIPGGDVLYAAMGAAIWENGIGLLGRVGEDYPQDWINRLEQAGFNTQGIRILPQALDVRSFIAYDEQGLAQHNNPVSYFAKFGLSFPRTLLDYPGPTYQLDSRSQSTAYTFHLNDIPDEFLDATAAHICQLDFLSQSLLAATLRQGSVNTLTLDASDSYMDPAFWESIPSIVHGLTAFMCSENQLRNLFQGRSTDLWGMAEALASYPCEMVLIHHGNQGHWLYDQNSHRKWIIPAYPNNISDPTGCDAAFCGGFLAGYRTTYDPIQACLYGSISASMVGEGSGPFYVQDALPGLAQARLNFLKEKVRSA